MSLQVDFSRAFWGGLARPRPLTPVNHPYAEVHHDVYDASLPAIEHCRAIEKQHRNQGWNGAFYNVGLDLDGRLWELRGAGWRSIGSHAARYNDGTPVSSSALTVVLFGNYQNTNVTSRQRDALDKIRNTLPDKRLRWHSMRAATACPGSRTVPVLQHMNTYHPAEGEEDQMNAFQQALLVEVHAALVENRYNSMGRTGVKVHDLATAVLNSSHQTVNVIPNRISALSTKADAIRDAAEAAATPDEVLGIIEAALVPIAEAIEGIEVPGTGTPGDAATIWQIIRDIADANLS